MKCEKKCFHLVSAITSEHKDMMGDCFKRHYVCTAELVMMLVSFTVLSMDTDSRIPSSTVG